MSSFGRKGRGVTLLLHLGGKARRPHGFLVPSVPDFQKKRRVSLSKRNQIAFTPAISKGIRKSVSVITRGHPMVWELLV